MSDEVMASGNKAAKRNKKRSSPEATKPKYASKASRNAQIRKLLIAGMKSGKLSKGAGEAALRSVMTKKQLRATEAEHWRKNAIRTSGNK